MAISDNPQNNLKGTWDICMHPCISSCFQMMRARSTPIYVEVWNRKPYVTGMPLSHTIALPIIGILQIIDKKSGLSKLFLKAKLNLHWFPFKNLLGWFGAATCPYPKANFVPRSDPKISVKNFPRNFNASQAVRADSSRQGRSIS